MTRVSSNSTHLTLIRKHRIKNIRKTSLYISIFLLTINLVFSGFNLYSIVTGLLLSFMVGLSTALIEVYLFPSSLNELNFTAVIVSKSLLYLLILFILIIP